MRNPRLQPAAMRGKCLTLETALEALSVRQLGGVEVKPKIIASTATVRRADSQIRALFNRRTVDIFLPAGTGPARFVFAHTAAGIGSRRENMPASPLKAEARKW